MNGMKERFTEVRERIATAAGKSGRSVEDVRLVAVSKTKPVEDIRSLLELGQRDFAENQMQEALAKIPHFEGEGLNWHFVGHLQSNKSRFVPGNFAWVHSADSEKLIRRIAQAAADSQRSVKLLLQVNVASDPAKHGVQVENLFPLIERIMEQRLEGIALCGLMTIGFRGAAEQDGRATFAGLRRLLEQCQRRFGPSFAELSMGMSGDYELAVEEGATMVRLGTALFGERT